MNLESALKIIKLDKQERQTTDKELEIATLMVIASYLEDIASALARIATSLEQGICLRTKGVR